jgi:hypothetical protein
MSDAAHQLARDGLPVFPCKNLPGQEGDKHPLTARGFYDASTNPNHIGNWWWRWPDALVGVPAGERFVVLDLDLQHQEAADWWAEHRESIPLTRRHHTRSGGMHLLFRPHRAVRCTSGKIHPHIDTRGHGGYIIWWPAEGHVVEHADQLAEVPDFIINTLTAQKADLQPRKRSILLAFHQPSPAEIEARLDGIVRTIACAPNGQRNSSAYWGACRLAEMVNDGCLGREDAIELVIEAASRTGLAAHEARLTALSAFRRAETEARI